jgi:PAP2 superfamily protein
MIFSIATANWKRAWQNKPFRTKLLIALPALIITLYLFTVLFDYIDQRPGVLLNDWLLNELPPHNVSVLIFIFIWSPVALAIARSVKDPDFFLLALCTYTILTFLRLVSIYLVALEPPKGLIPLIDPLGNRLYGNKFVTKDLFFSGHTSTMFGLAFCFSRRKDRIFGFLAATAVGFLVLVQHIHYTVDVISAPFFSFISYKIAQKLSFLQ